MSGCLSDLIIDRYLADELGQQERRALEAHAEACDGCAALLAQRREELSTYQARPELEQLAATTLHRMQQEAALEGGARPTQQASAAAARPWLPRLLLPLVGGLVGAAAAVVLVLAWPTAPEGVGGDPGGAGGGLRIKGGFSLGAFVKRGAAVSPARSGEVFHPGDELRFSYTTQRGGHLALVGVDAAGVVTLYHPAGPQADCSAPAAPGVKTALPGSTVLDATLGAETVVGLLCPRPFSTRTLQGQARQLAAALKRDGRAPAALLPDPACRAARFELDKRPAPEAGR